jgi:predicted porin
MKTSRFALAAAAGLLLSVAMTPAKAADLGGGCCADLEERVAELEATTARKGNRVVSLQIYGQVNKALLIWDDGVDSDAYVVDGSASSSRIGLKGKAQISAGWTAGYNIEFEIGDAQSHLVNNSKNGDDNGAGLTLRQNNFFIENVNLGRLTVGHQSVTAEGAYEVVVANSGTSSAVVNGNSLHFRYKNGTFSPYTLGNWGNNLDPNDPFNSGNDVVRYDSPSIYGFILSASWGDNDYADVALRFKKDFGTVRLAAAVAYQWDNQEVKGNGVDDSETFGGSISAMHMPTGLYASFQASKREYEGDANNAHENTMWYVQAGIERRMMSYGATTIYGEYGEYDHEAVVSKTHYEEDLTRWGFGLNQKIDAASMDIYAHATFWNLDAKEPGVTDPEDISTVMLGSKLSF